jgi:hypothetical protein
VPVDFTHSSHRIPSYDRDSDDIDYGGIDPGDSISTDPRSIRQFLHFCFRFMAHLGAVVKSLFSRISNDSNNDTRIAELPDGSATIASDQSQHITEEVSINGVNQHQPGSNKTPEDEHKVTMNVQNHERMSQTTIRVEIGVVLIKDMRRTVLSWLRATIDSIRSFMFGSPGSLIGSTTDDREEGANVVRETIDAISPMPYDRCDEGSGHLSRTKATSEDQKKQSRSWSVTTTDLARASGRLHDIYQQSDAVKTFPLTLTSPESILRPLLYGSTSTQHQCTAQSNDVATTLIYLQIAFNTPGQTLGRQDYRMISDSSCAVHIHIGNKSERFSLTTVKNVYKLLLTNEAAIDSSHAIHRVAHYSQSSELVQASNKSLSSRFTLPTPGFSQGTSLQDQLSYINEHKSIAALQHTHLEESGEHYSLNLWNLYCPADPSFQFLWNANAKKGTFEFRQSAGTLDPIEIHHRIAFYTAVVDFAEQLSLEEMDQICVRQRSTPGYDLLALLADMKCHPETIEYYRKKLSRRVIAKRSCWIRSWRLAISWLLGTSDFMQHFVDESEEDRLYAQDPKKVNERVKDNALHGLYGDLLSD